MLEEGEIAFGWVIAQNNRAVRVDGPFAIPSSYSEITYEFRDSTGFLIKGSDEDGTKSFFEEIIVPVFYDPQNPCDNTVLTNLEEIVKRGEE